MADRTPGPGSTRLMLPGSTRYVSRGNVGNEEILFLPRELPLLRDRSELVPLRFDPPDEGAGLTAGELERPDEPVLPTEASRLRDPELEEPRVTPRPASPSAFRLEGAGAVYPALRSPAVLLPVGSVIEELVPAPVRPYNSSPRVYPLLRDPDSRVRETRPSP